MCKKGIQFKKVRVKKFSDDSLQYKKLLKKSKEEYKCIIILVLSGIFLFMFSGIIFGLPTRFYNPFHLYYYIFALMVFVVSIPGLIIYIPTIFIENKQYEYRYVEVKDKKVE